MDYLFVFYFSLCVCVGGGDSVEIGFLCVTEAMCPEACFKTDWCPGSHRDPPASPSGVLGL